MFDKLVYPADPSCVEPRLHPPGDDTARHNPAVDTQATITVAAGINGERYVVTAFSFTLAPTSGLLSVTTVGASVIDGGTGGTTYLWREVLGVGTAGPIGGFPHMSGLNIVGSQNTSLTIEFSGAVTNAIESVNLAYHKIGGGGA